jgi:hypothetical protein
MAPVCRIAITYAFGCTFDQSSLLPTCECHGRNLHIRKDYPQGSISIVPPLKYDSEGEDDDRCRERITIRLFEGGVPHVDRNKESRMFRRLM